MFLAPYLHVEHDTGPSLHRTYPFRCVVSPDSTGYLPRFAELVMGGYETVDDVVGGPVVEHPRVTYVIQPSTCPAPQQGIATAEGWAVYFEA